MYALFFEVFSLLLLGCWEFMGAKVRLFFNILEFDFFV